MNPEDFIRQMQGGMGGQQQSCLLRQPTTVELDLFIDRCCKEKDETLLSLAQSLQWTLQRAPMVTHPQQDIYPMVLQRIQERLNKGEV